MLKHLIVPALLLCSTALSAQDRLGSTRELSVNAFRNPSIGLEYRFHHVSAHAGYYPTNFESGITTTFFRAGLSLWLLPFDTQDIPSSVYLSGSYLRGLSRDYEHESAVMADVGVRWMVWRGLNARIGAAMLMGKGHAPQFNPTIGIGYAFLLTQ